MQKPTDFNPWASACHFAAVHWRSDGHDGNRLGEQVAISILRQQNPTLLEPHIFRFTSFDGKVITI